MGISKDSSPPPPGRRVLDSDELGLLLLLLIGSGDPRHGYDLIKDVKARSGGNYAPSPGILYPRLGLMVDQGLLTSAAPDEARRAYGLTGARPEARWRPDAGAPARRGRNRRRGGPQDREAIGRRRGCKTALRRSSQPAADFVFILRRQ
jgi:DNA-binding PadR family transcriptional regulator